LGWPDVYQGWRSPVLDRYKSACLPLEKNLKKIGDPANKWLLTVGISAVESEVSKASNIASISLLPRDAKPELAADSLTTSESNLRTGSIFFRAGYGRAQTQEERRGWSADEWREREAARARSGGGAGERVAAAF